ncbi:MAG: ribonuclease H-like domain-containing protein, partial [Lachnospiraceae bacterium]|nr:ribonuclease H-like domain-containing protein [Candidatus Equihabitans merdae]
MNTKNESVINTLSAQILSHFPEPVVLSIETTGHFWRNSYIESMTLVAYDQSKNSWIGQTFSGEKEEDEFDMLTALSSFDMEGKTLLTFNGTAFALPYLKRKMKAYGLDSSLDKA